MNELNKTVKENLHNNRESISEWLECEKQTLLHQAIYARDVIKSQEILHCAKQCDILAQQLDDILETVEEQ